MKFDKWDKVICIKDGLYIGIVKGKTYTVKTLITYGGHNEVVFLMETIISYPADHFVKLPLTKLEKILYEL